jgi:hypothetical protein
MFHHRRYIASLQSLAWERFIIKRVNAFNHAQAHAVVIHPINSLGHASCTSTGLIRMYSSFQWMSFINHQHALQKQISIVNTSKYGLSANAHVIKSWGCHYSQGLWCVADPSQRAWHSFDATGHLMPLTHRWKGLPVCISDHSHAMHPYS